MNRSCELSVSLASSHYGINRKIRTFTYNLSNTDIIGHIGKIDSYRTIGRSWAYRIAAVAVVSPAKFCKKLSTAHRTACGRLATQSGVAQKGRPPVAEFCTVCPYTPQQKIFAKVKLIWRLTCSYIYCD